MRSQGPVRKRHKGRTLFGGLGPPNDSTIEASIFQDGLLNTDSEDILITFPRSRSNTVDSFPAAMDSSLFTTELPTESLILPEIRTHSLPESIDTKPRSDTIDFLSKCDSLFSPRGRSDTIDFLTVAVGSDLVADNHDDEFASPLSPIKIPENSTSVIERGATADSNEIQHSEGANVERRGVAFGKTPKKNNLSVETISNHDPIKKRYRTRSLSYASSDPSGGAACPLETKHVDNVDEDDIATTSDDSFTRMRSNTLESFQNALLGRSRSDTMDFLTAAVAGDMGHDLDAALAAATADGASFAMHPISAPSGASVSHASNLFHPSTRSRSNTLDSIASSINSSKLDFLVSVAVEEGGVLGLVTDERLRDRTESTGDESLDHPQRRPRSNTLEIYSSMAAGRGRSDTVDFLLGTNDDPVGNIDDVIILPDDPNSSGCVLDHLKALCDEPVISTKTTGILRRSRLSSGAADVGSSTVTSPRAKFEDESTRRTRANSEHTSKTKSSNSLGSSSQRLIKEALQHFEDDRRNRTDSWGGMSDLSVTGMDPSTIAATHDALKSTGIIDDLMAAAADLGDDLSDEPEDQIQKNRTNSGGTNSLSGKGRPRLDSLASLSLASLSDASISVSGRKEQYASELVQKQGAASKTLASTPGSQSIVVDYDAIASAVNAANAVTEGLDLNSMLASPSQSKMAKPQVLGKPALSTSKPVTSAGGRTIAPKMTKVIPATKLTTPNVKMPMPRLAIRSAATPATAMKSSFTTPKSLSATPSSYIPLAAQNTTVKQAFTPKHILQGKPPAGTTDPKPKPPVPSSIDIPIPKCTKTEAELEAIRQRARAAAGYVPPIPGAMPYKVGSVPYKVPPRKPATPYHPVAPQSYSTVPLKKRPNGPPTPFTPSATLPPSGYVTQPSQSRASTLQSQQKWDDMFEYLVKFIEETRAEETKGMTDEEKSAWVWDGNVPTNYKTKCGKALGRWINNQRSAKTKGTLKDDREVRLVSTGLKWSVLTTNSWNEMLRELEIYAEQKRQGGKTWDGNVPTNYKITVERTCSGRKMEEEKNLGRWVNRQRSLYQSGKLKKQRQIDLEKVGLKWSVLLTASWGTMFECLCNYAKERRAENNGIWDGNVPTNCRIESKPPVNLGRWVNRQRCAYAKGRLKEEFVTKLERTGLKWSMHDQKKTEQESDDEDDFEGEEFIPKDEYQRKVAPEQVPSTNPSKGNGAAAPLLKNATAGAPSPKTAYFTTQAGVKENSIVSSLPRVVTKETGASAKTQAEV
eukprot:CCRYP_019016-RA/>CCRYP_019016-RA protein AED:0.01 eAED:0.01 QI:1035/1/1/1/1/1/2/1086/1262